MNRYHLKIYFSNTVNYETYVDSQLDIEKFTDEIDSKFDKAKNKFILFVGEDVKYSINTNNVLFYTIEEVTKQGEQISKNLHEIEESLKKG